MLGAVSACGGSSAPSVATTATRASSVVTTVAAQPSAPAGDRSIEIVKSGFTAIAGNISCGVIIHNRDVTEAIDSLRVQVNFIDAAGNVAGNVLATAGVLAPDETEGIDCSGAYLPVNRNISRLDIQPIVGLGQWGTVTTQKRVTIETRDLDKSKTPYQAHGSIKNPLRRATGSILLNYIAYDARDQIIGGGSSIGLGGAQSGASAFVTSTIDLSNDSKDVDHVVLYVVLRDLLVRDLQQES